MESSMKNGWLEFDLSHVNYEVSKPFFVTFEQITDIKDRAAIADGYREYIRKHPNKLTIDTIEFEGKKEVVRGLSGGGIDLPGTFIAISNSPSRLENYACFVRETSFGEWKKMSFIVTATVTVSNQHNKLNDASKLSKCKENDAVCNAQKIVQDFIDETGMNGMQVP